MPMKIWKRYRKHYQAWERLPEAKRATFERQNEDELRYFGSFLTMHGFHVKTAQHLQQIGFGAVPPYLSVSLQWYIIHGYGGDG